MLLRKFFSYSLCAQKVLKERKLNQEESYGNIRRRKTFLSKRHLFAVNGAWERELTTKTMVILFNKKFAQKINLRCMIKKGRGDVRRVRK